MVRAKPIPGFVYESSEDGANTPLINGEEVSLASNWKRVISHVIKIGPIKDRKQRPVASNYTYLPRVNY